MEFCFDCENLCFYWDYSSARHIVGGIGSEVNGMGNLRTGQIVKIMISQEEVLTEAVRRKTF